MNNLIKYTLGWFFRSLNIWKYRLRYLDSYIGRNVIIKCDKRSKLKLGKNVTISDGTIITLDSLNEIDTELLIEDDVYIGNYNNIRACGKCIIGKNSLISHGIYMIGINHSFKEQLPIKLQPWDESKIGFEIKEDVWIGANSIILPGVRVGAGSIIGAGTTVLTSINEDIIVYNKKYIEKRNRYNK